MASKPHKLEKLDICVDDEEGVVCATVVLKPLLRNEKRVKYTSAQIQDWLLQRGIATLGLVTGGVVSNKDAKSRTKTFVFEISKRVTEQTTTAILEREAKKKTKKKKS